MTTEPLESLVNRVADTTAGELMAAGLPTTRDGFRAAIKAAAWAALLAYLRRGES